MNGSLFNSFIINSFIIQINLTLENTSQIRRGSQAELRHLAIPDTVTVARINLQPVGTLQKKSTHYVMKQIRVLEVGNYIAGPLLTKHLSNLGFSVTRIVRPQSTRGKREEELYMHNMSHELSAGKTIVTLDLKLKQDKEKFYKHVCNTDIIVENFGIGVSKRLGIDFETCKEINHNVIYASLPGYSTTDDEFKDYKAWESIIMASSGIFCDMGLNRTLLGIEGSFSPLPLASVYASIYGLFAVLCAYFQERFGKYIEIPLSSSLAEALVHNSIKFPLEKCYMNLRQVAIKEGSFPVSQESLKHLIDPFFSKYFCKDGRPIYIVCPAHRRHQERFLKELNIYEKVTCIVNTIDPYSEMYMSGLGCGSLCREHADLIRPIIQEVLLTKTAFEWEHMLAKKGVPAIAHRSMEEWINHSHTKESGLIKQTNEGVKISPLGWLTDEDTVDNTDCIST